MHGWNVMNILQIKMIKNIFLCIGHTRKLEVGDIFENIIVQFQTNASFHLLNTDKLYFQHLNPKWGQALNFKVCQKFANEYASHHINNYYTF